jgi:hypothetical protein
MERVVIEAPGGEIGLPSGNIFHFLGGPRFIFGRFKLFVFGKDEPMYKKVA